MSTGACLAHLGVVCVLAIPVSAQPSRAPLSAHVLRLEGAGATLVRDGRPVAVAEQLPLLEGDRLVTQAACVEMSLPDGSWIALDHGTAAELMPDSVLRLTSGRILFGVARAVPAGGAYRIETPAGSLRIRQAGEYRLSVVPDQAGDQVRLHVVRGEARFSTAAGVVTARSGEAAKATAGGALAPARPAPAPSASAFDRWVMANHAAAGSASRPNAVERPWSSVPGSPYERAQAVAADRVAAEEDLAATAEVASPQAPPADARPLAAAPARRPSGGARPSVLERPWSDDPGSPYGRAQAVAAERSHETLASGDSPYPDRYRQPVPIPFRPDVAPSWRPPVTGAWNWNSGGYPTMLAAPRSPTGAGLWLLFPAPWMSPTVAAPRGRSGSMTHAPAAAASRRASRGAGRK